ncbi:MAG: ATP-binding cassette domain-containing protein [Propionibacteriaceae bacterium]|jgi:putative ABC transport system ATP-binding protein/lipoprotein-releasing system ATP-binding protein|nr:ATP-binding cassette domain-containing protein [Propionibacteriaceae bacterium]
MRLRLEGVGHCFADAQWLFRGVTADFETGTTTAVTGPSGSGKSTLLALMAGSLYAAEGTVARQGIERTQWVFQNPFGVARRAAIDHVVLPIMAVGGSRDQATDQAMVLMEQFGLASVAARPFAQLSGGEAQRLMLARAVASQPHLLLVDEPTAQLDHQAAVTVAEALSSLSLKGTIVAVATHDPLTRDACQSIVDLTRYATED